MLEAALEHDPVGCVLQLTCAVGGIPQADLTGRVKDFHAILRWVHDLMFFFFYTNIPTSIVT